MFDNARYSVRLKSLLDNPETKVLIEKALANYRIYTPIHKELYGYIPTRKELNNKILNYYKYYEIGFETIGRFIEELEITMNEIMPYYNQMFKSVDVMNNIDDIFGNVDMVESYEETTTGSVSGESNGTSKGQATSTSETKSNIDNYNKNVETNTPQGNISKLNTEIDEVSYADKITWNHTSSIDSVNSTGNDTTSSESTNTSSSESLGTTKHTSTRKGNQGVNTYAHDMLEFRELFTNIEQEIIHDSRLRELFMLVY